MQAGVQANALCRLYERVRRAVLRPRVQLAQPVQRQYGYVTPISEYYDEGFDGPCREFEQTVYINGTRAEAHGVACRDGDGSWRIVNS